MDVGFPCYLRQARRRSGRAPHREQAGYPRFSHLELVYKNAKAELCGDRKLGLIKYVMALMNGARLGIAAQSVGLSQAAYNEGLAYAKDRKQFGKASSSSPPCTICWLS